MLALAACSPSAGSAPPEAEPVSLVDRLLGDGDPIAEARWMEERIESCMLLAGFDYVALVAEQPPETHDRRSEGFRSEFGFGISIDTSGDPILISDDPNLDAWLALGEGEQTAYDEQFAGCREDARVELEAELSDVVRRLSPSTAELLDALSFGTHPDLFETEDEWVVCMSEAGWDFVSQQEMYDLLRSDAERLGGDDVDEADREAIRDRERAVAVDELTCWRDTIEPTLDRLRNELDAAVLDEIGDGALDG